ncbi:MAG: APC family permease, partial [Ignavibacteria bacterium]|nr:APC family permease [Ignavibacteria bacterium]
MQKEESESLTDTKQKVVSGAAKAIVLSSVMFVFISFWRATAIVFGDLGSTMYYIGGIAEQFVGQVAPYFILLVMLFSFAVTGLYVESSHLYTRGGVYRVVKFALGDTFAKVSVSALVFDYVLTGPISSVSAGQYFVGFLNESFENIGLNLHLDRNFFSMIVAIIVIIYFWWENVKGIEESSSKALKILIITVFMGALVLVWGIISLILREKPVFEHLPPLKIELSDEAYGWFKDWDWIKSISLFSILIAFGHSLLAMSGLETLGQVYREVEYPKLENFKKAALAIFLITVTLTPGMSFLSVMLIPDSVRPQYIDNLIGGITMYLVAPQFLKLIVHSFVVIVGVLILSAAVNTSIVGANSVLNRVAEDKILTDWLRKPSKKFGTTHRMLTLIAGMQILTVILSRGEILLLGEAYAFGVIWSMTFKAFSMIVLRYKDKRPRDWKYPINFYIKNVQIPVGLITVFLILFFVALTNLFTKPIATVSGISFTLIFFIIFVISEYINKKTLMSVEKLSEEEYLIEKKKRVLEHFNLEDEYEISPQAIGSELNDRVLVAVKDPNNLNHLQKVLNET